MWKEGQIQNNEQYGPSAYPIKQMKTFVHKPTSIKPLETYL